MGHRVGSFRRDFTLPCGRVAGMDLVEEDFQRLGSFEPLEARRIFPALEAAGIPFDVKADHSALAKPGRWLHLYFALSPEGSKLETFVPASRLEEAQALIVRLFPV